MKQEKNTAKNIAFVITLLIVIGAIYYLQKPAVSDVKRVTPLSEIQNTNTDTSTPANPELGTPIAPETKPAPKPAPKKRGTITPELTGIAGYINTNGKNITLQELIGKKVILVDIWTYSCINCQRTLPYITTWYDRYHDQGLEIIGVHSPEFEFEKNIDNVKRATEKFGIKYPVVLDNDHATWNAFRNQYWPRKYLIDIDGYIAYDHIGEGDYDTTEAKIQELLKERSERLGIALEMPTNMSAIVAPTVDYAELGTPEIYLGHAFTRGNFGSREGLQPDQEIQYTLPSSFKQNDVYLDGTWYVDGDNVRLVSDTGKVVLKYQAKNVNIVASASPGSNVTTLIDGKTDKMQHVTNEDLYHVVDTTDYGTRTLELDVSGKGFKLYTFTFG